jgi:hypothetical protein
MTSTTKKGREFVGSPLSSKNVPKSTREIPGIGEAYSAKMAHEDGIRHAHQLLGLCLLYDMDRARILKHLTTKFGMAPQHALQAYEALHEYSSVHLGTVAAKGADTVQQ